MAQHVRGHGQDVIGQHVVPAREEGQGLARGLEGQAGPGAGAAAQQFAALPGLALAGPRGLDQAHDVGADGVVQSDGPGPPARLQDLLRAHHGEHGLLAAVSPAQHFHFVRLAGVVDAELEEEAIHLRLGQREGALLLQGVLGGQHEEGIGQGEALLAQGDLTFLHGLQQCGLHLGRGAIDLVRQQQVREDGAALGREGELLGIEDERAHHVAGQQVRRELDAAEAGVAGCGQGLDGAGLRQARQAFQQHMAAAEQGHQQAVQQQRLAHDHLAAFGEQRVESVGGSGGHGGSGVCSILPGKREGRNASVDLR